MRKKKKVKKTNPQKVQEAKAIQQPEKSNILIFGGLLLSMSSIGILIFILSTKIFHLN